MFENRGQAGFLLALKLKKIITKDFVVVALMRGGIVLGKQIADFYKIPLYPLVIRKISVPDIPELAIGAIGPKKTVYLDKESMKYFKISSGYKAKIIEEKAREVRALEKIFGTKKDYKNKKVILVDDGVATGASAICASIFLRKEKAEKTILAIPVISEDILRQMGKYFDRVVVLREVKELGAVGNFYKYFPQISTEEALGYMV